MKILFIGDIYGKPGREALNKHLTRLKKEKNINWCIVNGENAAAGRGLTKKLSDELFDSGADILTTGNHVWDQKEYVKCIDFEEKVIRPLNFPPGNPGRGWIRVQNYEDECPLTIVQLQGRVFMNEIDCPFQAMDKLLEKREEEDYGFILVDFHAEASSEKIAMGWYLDGKVGAVVGTHTHVQTADEIILPNGTAFISDVGMTGPHKSVIGAEIEEVIHKYKTNQPVRFKVAKDDVRISGVVITVDTQTRKALDIERFQIPVDGCDKE